jgi:hypothetical protein
MVMEFRLSPAGQDQGISCDFRGAFVGSVPLLRRQRDPNGQGFWAPRPAAELNSELSQRYRVPVEFSAKAGDLANIANALNRGDVFNAQLATQRLQLPDPPAAGGELLAHNNRLETQLRDSGILDVGWRGRQPIQLQRSGSRGPNTDFVPPNPVGNIGDGVGRIIKAQELLLPSTVPMELPLDVPWDWEIPWRTPQPGDFGPMPMNPAGRYEYRKPPGPRENPYPDDPDCEWEWNSAKKQCTDWAMKGLFEQTSSFGSTLAECVRNLVSVRCGGTAQGEGA